jgi:hypothetical protein
MSFITNQFWISLYMQDVQHLSPLIIAVRLLPQALVGMLWSYIGQSLMSKIPGRIIMGIGGIAYLVGATLQIFVKENTSYWMFLFPSLCITVIGADFQFIVSNVRLPFRHIFPSTDVSSFTFPNKCLHSPPSLLAFFRPPCAFPYLLVLALLLLSTAPSQKPPKEEWMSPFPLNASISAQLCSPSRV